MIGVEGRATMTVQFTKQDRYEVGSLAGIFPILANQAILRSTFDLLTSDDRTNLAEMYVHKSVN